MIQIMITVLNMSITASIAAAAVMLVRLLLKKAPRIFSYMLWAVVFLRLLCPLTLESPAGLMPVNSEVIPPAYARPAELPSWQDSQANDDIWADDIPGNDIRSAPYTSGQMIMENYPASVSPIRSVLTAGAGIWLCGLLMLILWQLTGYIRLNLNVYDATRIQDNIYETDKIATAFVMGLIRPRIYLPTVLEDDQREFVLRHEQIHIRRCDHLVKLLAFLGLAVHWFNPVIWISYYLMSKDMEMSCDEAVLRKSDHDIRQGYSAVLVHLYTRRPGMLTPLAFGEGSIRNMKTRIKNVLKFRKTPRWVIILCSLLLVLFTAGFTTSPPRELSAEIVTAETVTAAMQTASELTTAIDSYYSAQNLRPYRMLQKSRLKGMLENGWLDNLEGFENPMWNYDSFARYQILDDERKPVWQSEELYYCTFSADNGRQGYVVISYNGSGMGRITAAETAYLYDLRADQERITAELLETELDLSTLSAVRVGLGSTGQGWSDEAILFTDGQERYYVYQFAESPFVMQQAGGNRSQTRRTDSLKQEFAKYKFLGVDYDVEQDAVYYHGERVKLFVEFLSGNENEMTYAFDLCFQDLDCNSTLYLEVFKDSNGAIAGIRELDKGTADALLEVMGTADVSTDTGNGDRHFITMDGTQYLENYGITAKDMTKDQAAADVKDWMKICDQDPGVYTRTTELPDGYLTYVYYNGGGRYPWNMSVSGDSIIVSLFQDSRFAAAEDYYLMYFTAPKNYTDVKLYLDGNPIL